jgi:hypothetical protein
MAIAFEFNAKTFEQIQQLVFPLVATLFEFDPAAFVGDKAELFNKVGATFDELAELFYTVGTALEDGYLKADEVEAIITQALDVPAAIKAIEAEFKGDAE